MTTPPPSCWILTDGRIGSENHARGVAEALGLDYTVHPVALRQPWKSLSPWLLRWIPAFAFRRLPAPPWPDVLITCGRKIMSAVPTISFLSFYLKPDLWFLCFSDMSGCYRAKLKQGAKSG